MRHKVLIASIALFMPTLAAADQTIAALQPDTQVTVSGTVDRIADEDTFILRDDTGKIAVYLGPNLVPVSVDSSVTVNGIVDDGPTPEIYASSLETSTGEVITFDHSYN
ncbi:hypothetical protein [Roseobacter sp. CCS2]|uniref:hypothetical protein n=1 Tax=Roseobacter sp. CCS2 TaxID=391593 RepID=UPI0000F3C7A3|nr:hypothetical protein [Roseobacter sp. CCS2]EBA11667.1 hypothetical protein RCCS2_17101 [Roseobacter sp. CCS2]